MRRWLLVALGLLALACGGGSAGSGGSTDSSPSAAPACSPQPCAVNAKTTVYVTAVQRSFRLSCHTPDPGKHTVRLMVRWEYSGSETESVAGNDLALIGADRQVASALDVIGCKVPDCVIGGGEIASGGSVTSPVCYDVGGDPNGKLEVRWQPGILRGTTTFSL